MICPLKCSVPLRDNLGNWLGKSEWECEYSSCAWWDSKANFNHETKQFEGQCCILTLAQLKISGGVNTHSY